MPPAEIANKPKPPEQLDEAIGRLSRAWAHLELGLTVVLSELMEIRPETALVLSAALDYGHRRDLITSLAALKLRGSAPEADLKAFMGSVQGMSTERNNTIHALWLRNPETQEMQRLTMRTKTQYKMKFLDATPGHLRTVAEKINILSNQGVALAAQIREAVHTWREKFEPLEWHHLGWAEDPPGAHKP